MVKPAIKAKSFEATIDEPVHEQVRQALLRSRKSPEVIYLNDKAVISKVQEILTALHGLRGQRIPVLLDPDLRSPFEIKWGV